MKVLQLLFCCRSNAKISAWGLLLIRLFAGSFMLTHSLSKISNFSMLAQTFPDPIGLGSSFALSCIIFAEFGCSILLILGIFSRLAAIPLMIGMSVAAFSTHAGDPFAVKELALVYLCIYISLLILGPGNFSLDYYVSKFLKKRKQ